MFYTGPSSHSKVKPGKISSAFWFELCDRWNVDFLFEKENTKYTCNKDSVQKCYASTEYQLFQRTCFE